MAEDYRDKIQEIRARRRGGDYANTRQPQSPYDSAPSIGISGGGGGGQGGLGGLGDVGGGGNRVSNNLGINVPSTGQPTESLFGPDFKSPWLRDRVTLSLEGQIAMIEGRSNSKVNLVDLGYTNRIPILPIRSGIFVKVEPPGTYKLSYHYR